MTKQKRNYSQKTLKYLFALSGNKCAYPDCTNPLFEPATEFSKATGINNICHIYAFSENGPRGKPGLTKEELNSPENLILLCQNHHAMVDGQHETYPADLLKEWKKTHELLYLKRFSKNLENAPYDVISNHYFPTELVDRKIESEVDIIRKTRFFAEFDVIQFSLILARRLVKGELSGGTKAVRKQALAWCARFLSPTKELDKAEEYLKLTKDLGPSPEIEIANAFINSQKGEKKAAISALALINSPISWSAALMVVAHHEGYEGAVDWLKTVGITSANLDPDGKHFLLMLLLELSRWEAALECLDDLTDEDFCEAPILNHLVAITHLLSTVPIELRADVLKHIPIYLATFPLASNKSAIAARREAHRHFVNAAHVEKQLNCSHAASIDDEYALWLELRDSEQSGKGKRRLEVMLRDPKSALRLVPFGLQFGIKLNLETIEREIERQIALHGEMTRDAAIARFALSFSQKTAEDGANYIERYGDELAKYFNKKLLKSLQIEMFSRAGLPERANECLEFLLGEGLSDEEETNLVRIIAEAEGSDPIRARKERFKNTDSFVDLVSLVKGLETKGDLDNLCIYSQILFDRTHSLLDAERLVDTLSKSQKHQHLVDFLKANKTLLAQSKNLQMLYCWSLYHLGLLQKAKSELVKLSDDQDNLNYRTLKINIGISMGDWNSLSAFVATECLEKNKRSSQELIGTAHLALILGTPNAKELLFSAAEKGNDDAGVLTAAYFLASNAGMEGNPEVSKWLFKAAELSGNDGPIQKTTLKDILDRKPEWDRRESEIFQLLNHGDIPMFLAAQSLNKSLIDLMLFPALVNLSENDPRRRVAIPAYSGKRQPTSLGNLKVVGIDATALLTLSFLNLLDETFDAFDTVYVPHSTLSWLLDEKGKTAFHQPSRIKDAHLVRNLLSNDALEKLSPSTVPDGDLSAQVGDELALLIAEAEKTRENDDAQRIVVRSAPVHQLSSLMEEEADLTLHEGVLCNCMAVVNKLRQKGLVTTEEEKKAHAYLQLHEKPWPNQPEIIDGAILYLDDLAITYFLPFGILEKLKTAGFKPIVSPRMVSEIDKFISYESISGKAKDVIDRIQSTINPRIESGKIKVGRRRNINELKKQSIFEHPSVGVFALARDCEAIITDDRFLNQYSNIDDGSAQAPVFSTLDLLDTLVSICSIKPDDRLEYRTLLRRVGYFFVPVTDDELAYHLNASAAKNDKVIETAELKAIRENILRIRMSTWLQLPKEALWLDISIKAFVRVLKSLWRADADLSSVRTRSDWLINQVDIRGWAHRLGGENGDNIVNTGRGGHILMVLTPPVDVPKSIKDEYWNWVEIKVLAPIKEQYPDLYYWIVDWYKRQIVEFTDKDLSLGSHHDK